MPNPWATYEKARSERETLEPLKIPDGNGKEEVFEFPASPPAKFFMEFLQMIRDKEMTEEKSIMLLLSLVQKGDKDRLVELTTSAELVAIFNDLLTQYGFVAKGDEAPNRKARRASRKPSSTTSARSKQTSVASTG